MVPYKFSDKVWPTSTGYTYPNIWAVEKTTGPDRLIIAPSSDQVGLMIELASVLPEPFGILYVLLVSRCDNAPGRYQSPYPIDRSELESFLSQFKDYFENDGRHHIWIMSLPLNATLVYDNHNVIYAYGPIQEYTHSLVRRNFKRGEVKFPSPHTHEYNQEFDEREKEIFNYWDWLQYPLHALDD